MQSILESSERWSFDQRNFVILHFRTEFSIQKPYKLHDEGRFQKGISEWYWYINLSFSIRIGEAEDFC